MIQLPVGFDVGLLLSDFFALATPVAGVLLILASGFLILRILKRV